MYNLTYLSHFSALEGTISDLETRLTAAEEDIQGTFTIAITTIAMVSVLLRYYGSEMKYAITVSV